MKIFNSKFFFLSVSALLLASCERGEPLNKEADITSIALYGGNDYSQLLVFADGDLNENINLFIPECGDVSDLKVVINVSEGATLTPPSNKSYDFTDGMVFNVLSEDKEWQRNYNVTIDSTSNLSFDFETWNVVTSGQTSFMEPEGWTSANKGVQILITTLGIDYPTYRTEDAYSGNYALEMTSRFGKLGGGMIPPLISGSAFLGNFNTNYLMSDNLMCAEFGVPFNYNGVNKPKKLRAALKYKPGESFTDENGMPVDGKTDNFSFYAVIFYGDEPLTARNMNQTDRIIAKAVVDGTQSLDEYTVVEADFDYESYLGYFPEGKPIQISIVAGSSAEGDYYRGAVGSTLTVDDVEILF